MSTHAKQKLDLSTIRALMGDDQSFSQRNLILELVQRCEIAEARLLERERPTPPTILPRVDVSRLFNPSSLPLDAKCTRCGKVLGRFVVPTDGGARHEICPEDA